MRRCCAVTRLYKDGIGAAYREAKVAAATAVWQGISAEDFRRHYAPPCQAVTRDNNIEKFIFWIARVQQKERHARQGILKMIADEQNAPAPARRLSTVM